MPYAVNCPRCRAVVVIETLGAFECPHCGPGVMPGGVQEPPARLPPTRAPAVPAPYAATEIEWKPPPEPARPRRPAFEVIEPDSAEAVDDDGDFDAVQRRRAARERERVARRKLLTKLGIAFVLLVACLVVVPAAISHVKRVAAHNAEIKRGR